MCVRVCVCVPPCWLHLGRQSLHNCSNFSLPSLELLASLISHSYKKGTFVLSAIRFEDDIQHMSVTVWAGRRVAVVLLVL